MSPKRGTSASAWGNQGMPRRGTVRVSRDICLWIHFWDEMPQDPAKSAPSLALAQTGLFSQHIPFMDNEASFLFIQNSNNNIGITRTSFGGFSGNSSLPPQKYHVPKKFSGIPGGSCFKDRLTPHLLELCPAKLLYYDTTCFLGIPLHVLTLVAFALFPWHPKVRAHGPWPLLHF